MRWRFALAASVTVLGSGVLLPAAPRQSAEFSLRNSSHEMVLRADPQDKFTRVVPREDALRVVAPLSTMVEWGKLLDSPARGVKRLKVDNRRTRVLTADEQARLLTACPRKLQALVALALITGARVGELLALRWEHCADGYLMFLETKNGRTRRVPLTASITAVLEPLPRVHPWVFTNSRTEQPFLSMRQVFDRAVARAGIRTGDVTFHTLRHTALSRMIAAGMDDYTVMAISGHSSTRMLARYTHPTDERKADALETFASRVVTTWSQRDPQATAERRLDEELAEFLRKVGGRQEARTPDLCVANAKAKRRQTKQR